MSRPIFPRDGHGALGAVEQGVASLRRRPLTGVWQIPYEETADAATIAALAAAWPGDSPIDPPPYLVNGWTHGSTDFGYRWHADGSLEFKGYLTPGTTNTVAITLPEPWWPAGDASFLTDVETSPGTFTIGRVKIDHTTGDVTIIFPAS